MHTDFLIKLATWIRADPDNETGIRSLKSKVDYLADVLYHEYRPTMAGQHGEFRYRLERWINSAATDEQKRQMFLLLEYLFFVGQKEFDALYLTAFSRHVAEWLLISENISITDPQAHLRMRQSVATTFFTAVTDSFNLGDFIRINGIQGANRRFIWEQGLRANFSEATFMAEEMPGKRRIVLLEDFVGSGSQMERAVHAACSLAGHIPVLLCPLVICPDGAALARQLANQYQNLTFRPALELHPKDFVRPTRALDEPVLFEHIRNLVQEVHPLVVGNSGWNQNYGPFGYEQTGALIVKFDNCPDNTLPLLHRASDSPWHPLFFRVSREMI